METSARSVILFSLQAAQRLVGWSLMLLVLAFLVIFGLQFPHSPKVDELGFIISLRNWANPLIAEVGSWVDAPWPTTKSLSFLPLVIAFTIWLGKLGIDATFQTVLRVVSRKLKAAKAVSDEVLAELEGRITADSEQAREELLKKYRDIEQALKSSRRKRCAFLSVDVVGSTEMKNNEEATSIAASFQAYEEMLREIFEKHGAWKTAWTPDGVMICFLQLDLAVAAAQRILEALPNFNRRQNKLRTPFRVRCGINEGEVAIFEDSKLEKVADHTIDVAGHMQKHCRTNALWLGEPVFSQLKNTEGFIPLDKTVDGYKVYEWSQEPIDMAAVAPGGAPAPEKTVVAPRAKPVASAANRIGRYEILGELGKGAMGVVYKAKDPQIGRTVAIKMILTGTQTEEELEEYKQRFYREAQTAGQMSHPGIVTIYDVSEDSAGQPYLVMEFVEGKTLDRMLAPSKPGEPPQLLDLKQTLNIAWQVADALDYAHKRNVIHRDIKPANILVTPEGKAKIADFGIAKMSGTQMTQTGLMVGTPAFMAPEQITGKGADARSDIFAFGVMLYWMVTGRRPFAGSAITEVAYKVVHASPESPRKLNANVPPGVEVILGRCLAKDPAKRYQSAGDVALDLEAVRYGRPISSTPIPMSPTPTA